MHDRRKCPYCEPLLSPDERRRLATADAEAATDACVVPLNVGKSGLSADFGPEAA